MNPRPFVAPLAVCAVLLSTLLSLPAFAADTLAITGALRTVAGGPVPDGKYAMEVKLTVDEAGSDVVFSEKLIGVDVQGGAFVAVLGTDVQLPLDGLAVAGDAAFVLVSIDGEPALPSVPLRPVLRAWRAAFADNAAQAQLALQALAADTAKAADTATTADTASVAEELSCTGCVTLQHLSPDVAGGFLATTGGTVEGKVTAKGGVDLAGAAVENATLSNAKLAVIDVASAPCAPADLGRLAIGQADSALYYCNGASWKKVAGCQGVCPDASAVACAQPLVDDCGDPCGPEGVLGGYCSAGSKCTAAGCVLITGSQANPAPSCKAILEAGDSTGDGVYWLDTDGAGPVLPFQALCDMSTDGGGWTLLGTISGADTNSWNAEVGNWGNGNLLGDVNNPLSDYKSQAWLSLDVSGAEVLFERLWQGSTAASFKLGNACLFGKATFVSLFETFDTSLLCGKQHLTVVQPAAANDPGVATNYGEGTGASGAGGADTNGFCWNGGDTENNTFKGHAGWNQSQYGCYGAGHLSYIGVSSGHASYYGNLDIDTTNWLNQTDVSKTAVRLWAR